jgi:beta-glucosidase
VTRRSGSALRRGAVLLALAVPLSMVVPVSAVAAPGSSNGHPPAHSNAGGSKSPDVESRVKPIIKVGQRQFRDLNANGKLDRYEDWRRPVGERVADLVGRMTLAEKAGLMLIDTLNAECDQTTKERGTLGPNATRFVNDQNMHRFIFRNVVTSPDKAVCATSGGGFAAGTSVTPAEAARYMNRVQ